jgi:hypothetical protein
MDEDIIVITFIENGRILASHGVGRDTDGVVVLPTMHPRDLGAKFDSDLGEYVIEARP